jgi:hypothetical protein
MHEKIWWYDEREEGEAWLLNQDSIVIFKPKESVSLLALVRRCVRLVLKEPLQRRTLKTLPKLQRKGRSNATG